MILIDYKDRRPIYEQVIEKFQQMILCGALEPDSPMPSVRSLAMELSLNPNTIQRAYQELERQGYIYTMKGKGSFVSNSLKAADHKRREIQEELEKCVSKVFMTGITENEFRDMVEISITNMKNKGNYQGTE
ncbi:MAG: GntR family transcriptional regulator [Alphaproteobacteria bacterium]|nr:GntR family transcriptional regulator [Alphaproteobacteria bacterium]MBQ6996086.1 GntR family transcriptional regulator [Lachnospiraceae bacterium]